MDYIGDTPIQSVPCFKLHHKSKTGTIKSSKKGLELNIEVCKCPRDLGA